jgi:hypothetical protein
MCLDNQRCADVIRHMQNVSLEVELRRFLEVELSKPDSVFFNPKLGLTMVKIFLDKRSAQSEDFRWCDNPPEGEL